MKKKLVFATNNAHKLDEISSILGEKVELLSLKDIHCHVDIPETADTLEGNAMLKAEYIYKNYGLDCFADDTGLEVEALNGAPGVCRCSPQSGSSPVCSAIPIARGSGRFCWHRWRGPPHSSAWPLPPACPRGSPPARYP